MRAKAFAAFLGSVALAWPGAEVRAEPARPEMNESTNAQTPSRAQRLFDDGLQNMLAGRYDVGCALLARSQDAEPKAGTVFTLAECYARAGRLASAVRKYAQYLALYEAMPAEQSRQHEARARIARAERDRLNPEVPRLILSWASKPPRDARLTLDGNPIDPTGLDRAQTVDPGEHVLRFGTSRALSGERRLLVKPHQTLRVVLPVSAGAPRSAPLDDPSDRESPSDTSSQRTWAYIVGGVGAAGIAAGTAAGVVTLIKKAEVDDHCRDVSSSRASCDERGLSASRAGKTWGTVSTVAFAVGVAGLGTGLTLLLTAPKGSTPTARAGLWSIDVGGSAHGGEFSISRSF